MRTRFTTCLLVVFCLFAGLLAAPLASSGWGAKSKGPAQSLKPTHPRLMIEEGWQATLKEKMESQKELRADRAELTKRAEALLKEPPVEYKDGDMLDTSRAVLNRVLTLATLYRLDKDRRFAERAEAELLAAASFPNWHPAHFLDTAEMMVACSLGYDWLFDTLHFSTKEKLREAIVRLGLQPAKDAYDHERYFWVTDNQSNWNIVCNGGVLIACLSLGKDKPAYSKLVSDLLKRSSQHLAQGLTCYDPDGAWIEGPTYWHYATKYAAMAISSLKTATGSDNEMLKGSGLAKTGNYLLSILAPDNAPFNYADSTDSVTVYSPLYWLSKEFRQPVLAYKERELLHKHREKVSGLDLIWYNDEGGRKDLEHMPTSQLFGGSPQVVTMRSNWVNPNVAFVGFKGGLNASHHSHLELGTFVYNVFGERWVSQLGMDSYSLPGYFDTSEGSKSKRWQYYRLGSEGQNTIILDNENQYDRASAPISDSHLDTHSPTVYAIANLSQAYQFLGITSLRRGVALNKGTGELLVQDEIFSKNPVTPLWQIHTRAEISIDGRHAVLTIGDKHVSATLLSPRSAHFSQSKVDLNPPCLPCQGMQKLTIGFTEQVTKEKIAVVFSPGTGKPKSFASPLTLSEWERMIPAPQD